MDKRITRQSVLGHLKTIFKHKHWVFIYACKLEIPWRGIKHDLSKFSPTEFWESVKYWDGKSSPIPKCKKENGYSLAWQHHKGRNSHHYEYWVDNVDRGGVAIKMPYDDVLELVADYLGAARAYLGKDFTLQGEYDWWKKKQTENIKMHLESQDLVSRLLARFAQDGKVQKPAEWWREAYEDGNLVAFYE